MNNKGAFKYNIYRDRFWTYFPGSSTLHLYNMGEILNKPVNELVDSFLDPGIPLMKSLWGNVLYEGMLNGISYQYDTEFYGEDASDNIITENNNPNCLKLITDDTPAYGWSGTNRGPGTGYVCKIKVIKPSLPYDAFVYVVRTWVEN